MITKRLNVYVPYLYAEIKYKSVPVHIKSKKRGGAYIIISKATVHFIVGLSSFKKIYFCLLQ